MPPRRRARAGGGPGILLALVNAPPNANLDYLEQDDDHLTTCPQGSREGAHFTINGSTPPHKAFVGLLLKPWDERHEPGRSCRAPAEGQLHPPAEGHRFRPPPLPGSTGGAPMQFVITTTGDYEISPSAGQDAAAARESGLFLFTDVDLTFDTPQFEFKVDADKANRLGVSM